MAKPEKPAEAPKPDGKARGKALFAEFNAAVNLQIGGDKHHGWGNKDSLAVIEAIVAKDVEFHEGEAKTYTLSDEAIQFIGVVINPSAFRQQLESKDDGRLEKTETKRVGSLKNLASEFGS
jgi:hypothetical protein